MKEFNESSVKTRTHGQRIFALLLVLCLAAGALGLTAALAEDNESKNEPAVLYESGRDAGTVEVRKAEPGTLMTIPEVYANCVESTVGIRTETTSVNRYGYASSSATAGSGFIVSENGYVVTNYHVVDSASTVTVSAYSGETYDAKIVGYDESNDVAVLKIDASDLKPVVFGSSTAINVGEEVAAIGNPLGELTFSLTSGIISAKDREISVSNGARMILLQTDCAINSGNSGGALFNMYGEVVGITNAKYSSSSSGTSVDNIGFAVPVDQVRPIIESIIENGYYSKPYIGVTIANVSDDMKAYGIPEGAVVKSVTEGSPADEAGLKVNDIITAVNGEEINGSTKLTKIVSRTPIGDKLRLTVYRKGETLELTVTVNEYKPDEPDKDESAPQQEQQQPSSGNGDNYYSYPYGYGYGNGNGGSIWDYFFGNGFGNGGRW